jgi:hypothetical protein
VRRLGHRRAGGGGQSNERSPAAGARTHQRCNPRVGLGMDREGIAGVGWWTVVA